MTNLTDNSQTVTETKKRKGKQASEFWVKDSYSLDPTFKHADANMVEFAGLVRKAYIALGRGDVHNATLFFNRANDSLGKYRAAIEAAKAPEASKPDLKAVG